MDAISRIYEALVDDEALANLPENLCSLIGARSMILQTFDEAGSLTGAHLNYFSDEMTAHYIANDLHRIDPWREPCTGVARNRLIDATEAIGTDAYLRSTFFNEFFRPFGDDTMYCLGSLIGLQSGELTLGIHRGRTQASFQAEELRTFAPLVPHLQRLFDTRARLLPLQTRGRLTEAALHAQADMVAIVSADGSPEFLNHAAERSLATGDGLTLRRGKIRAAHQPESSQFSAAVARACSTYVGSALTIRANGGRQLRAVVAPIPVSDRTFALVLVNDPAARNAGLPSRVAKLFGLTQAEAEILSLLAEGMNPAQAAEHRGVRLSTVRSQIQQALQKSGCNRLSDLLRQVTMVPRLSAGKRA